MKMYTYVYISTHPLPCQHTYIRTLSPAQSALIMLVQTSVIGNVHVLIYTCVCLFNTHMTHTYE